MNAKKVNRIAYCVTYTRFYAFFTPVRVFVYVQCKIYTRITKESGTQ